MRIVRDGAGRDTERLLKNPSCNQEMDFSIDISL